MGGKKKKKGEKKEVGRKVRDMYTADVNNENVC